MVQIVEAFYENGVIKPLSPLKANIAVVFILNSRKKGKFKKILKYAGILKNVKESEISKALEEVESGENFY